MDEQLGTGVSLERLVRPTWLLAGVACGFAACCLAGGYCGHTQYPRAFTRFHIYLTPSALYYPTASQIRNLGNARLDPDKIVVIVGGSSRLFGSGQTPGDVWTDHLQAELGDDYQVLNLAVGGGHFNEFGAVAAEILSAQFPRILFVGDVSPGGVSDCPDGVLYRYLFWDAYDKGMLVNDQEREEALARCARERADQHAFNELRAQSRLDRLLWFQDLWNCLTYSVGGTVYNRVMAGRSFEPRRKLADPERPPPPEQRYPEHTREASLRAIRACLTVCEPRAADGLEANGRSAVPGRFRARCLLLTMRHSPYFLDQITAEEQDRYDALCGSTCAALERCGYRSMEAGRSYTVADYFDECHLSVEGGRKLAAEVAPQVRALAARLGYAR